MFQVINVFSNTNIPRTIRFSEPIYNALMQTAGEENISFNLLVLQCCHYALSEKTQNNGGNTAENKKQVL